MAKTKTALRIIDDLIFNTFILLTIIVTCFVDFTEKQLGDRPKSWRDLF